MKKNSFLTALNYSFPFVNPRNKVFEDEKEDFLYFAIPKNANSYIKSIFLGNNSYSATYDPEKQTALQYLKANPKASKHVSAKRIDILLNQKIEKVSIFRDPAQRLVSAFLDKIVKRGKASQEVQEFLIDYTKIVGNQLKSDELNFEHFIEYVGCLSDYQRDPHIKTQTSFARGASLDKIFDFDNIYEFETFLRKKGFLVPESETFDKGVLKRTRYLSDSKKFYGCATLDELNTLEAYPDHSYFYNETILSDLIAIYESDLAVYLHRVKGIPLKEWAKKFPFASSFCGAIE